MVAAYDLVPSEAHSILIRTATRHDSESMLDVDRRPTEPAAAAWTPTEYYVAHPKKGRGDFLYTGSGNFACNRRVLDQMRPCLELDCEFLPITIEGLDDDEYFLVHPLTVVEALPPAPQPYSAIEAIRTLKTPNYRREAFDRPMIFREKRFPSRTQCISGLEPAERDFQLQCTKRGLSGFELKKVWEHPG